MREGQTAPEFTDAHLYNMMLDNMNLLPKIEYKDRNKTFTRNDWATYRGALFKRESGKSLNSPDIEYVKALKFYKDNYFTKFDQQATTARATISEITDRKNKCAI
jgi:hypothetical protein